MRLFNWKFTAAVLLVSLTTGVLFAYFQFNPWGRKISALTLYVEINSPLLNEATKPILEFYLERKIDIIPVETAADIRPSLVLSEHSDVLIFASWRTINQLLREGLLISWGSALQDTLTADMRIATEFIPATWDMMVEWQKLETPSEAQLSLESNRCQLPSDKKIFTHSLPRNHIWHPGLASFQTKKEVSQLQLWGFSYSGIGKKRNSDIEVGIYKFFMSDIFEKMLEKVSLGTTLKRFESNSETPRLRRSSFLKDVPLQQFKIKDNT